jgi:uncharacterized membrane protein YtjA (UPF0391 family)
MLHYAIVFLIIALIAAFLGFGSLAGTAALIAKVCFVLFLIFAIVSFSKEVSCCFAISRKSYQAFAPPKTPPRV